VVRPQVRRQRQHQLLERLDPLHVARAAAGWGSNGTWTHIAPQKRLAAPSHMAWAAALVPFDPTLGRCRVSRPAKACAGGRYPDKPLPWILLRLPHLPLLRCSMSTLLA
jgi:hypothetical protein